MKKILQISAALIVLALVASVSAQTLLTTTAAAVRDASVQEDQSKLPDQNSRSGYLMATYDVEVNGGTAGAIDFGPALPDNTAIVGGYIVVTEAVLPSTYTNSIGFLTATDILAAGTALGSTGLVIPGTSTRLASIASQSSIITNMGTGYTNVLTVVTNVSSTAGAGLTSLIGAPVVSTNATDRLSVTWGAAVTQGVFHVYLDTVKLQ